MEFRRNLSRRNVVQKEKRGRRAIASETRRNQMRRVIIVVVLIIGAAVVGLWRSNGRVREGINRIVSASGNNAPGGTSDEIRKTFNLKPGAHIEVQGINGKVDIQTSDTTTAEVYVLRTADDPGALRHREMIVEQTSEGLLVRSKQAHTGLWD